jgi:hypothetical protein
MESELLQKRALFSGILIGEADNEGQDHDILNNVVSISLSRASSAIAINRMSSVSLRQI